MRLTGQVSVMVAAWLVLTGLLTAEERGPNIVIILADDLGYADLGCQGCEDIPTPHIDSIARDGVRFTDGYATHPVCSPSRAGLMSGMYQHRFGFEHNSGPERYAAPNFGLPRNVPTLAEKLKTAGYATGMVGKWHIGFKEGLRPHERGFDESFVLSQRCALLSAESVGTKSSVSQWRRDPRRCRVLDRRLRPRIGGLHRAAPGHSRSFCTWRSTPSTHRWRRRPSTNSVSRRSPTANVEPMPE